MWLTKAHTSQEAPTSISGSGSLWEYGGQYEEKFFRKILGLTALMFTLLFTTASAEVYEGTGYGYHQDGIVLVVEIKDNKIIDIQIKKEQESDFAKPAIKEIIKKSYNYSRL